MADNDNHHSKKPATVGEIKRALGRIEAACQEANEHLDVDVEGQGEETPGLQQAKAAIAEATKEYGQLDLGVGAMDPAEQARDKAMLEARMTAEQLEEVDGAGPEIVKCIEMHDWEAGGKDTDGQLVDLICASMGGCWGGGG